MGRHHSVPPPQARPVLGLAVHEDVRAAVVVLDCGEFHAMVGRHEAVQLRGCQDDVHLVAKGQDGEDIAWGLVAKDLGGGLRDGLGLAVGENSHHRDVLVGRVPGGCHWVDLRRWQ